jgi:hypothetical protein
MKRFGVASCQWSSPDEADDGVVDAAPHPPGLRTSDLRNAWLKSCDSLRVGQPGSRASSY